MVGRSSRRSLVTWTLRWPRRPVPGRAIPRYRTEGNPTQETDPAGDKSQAPLPGARSCPTSGSPASGAETTPPLRLHHRPRPRITAPSGGDLCAEVAKLNIRLREGIVLDGSFGGLATAFATVQQTARNRWQKIATPTGFELPAGHFRKTEARRDLATVFGVISGDSVPAGRTATNRREPLSTAEKSAVVATTWQRRWPRPNGLANGWGRVVGRRGNQVATKTATSEW